MHIHIKPFRFILSNKTQNRNKEESMKKKPKKVVVLQFLFTKSRSWVKLSHHQPLIHHKYVTIKEQPKKKNQLCILGFLVRVDVYSIHLHLKNFLGTHEPYFAYASLKKKDIFMSLFSVGIGIISFGSHKLKLRHFNSKLVGMPSSLGYLLLFSISEVLTP